jgi:hypothetical protein
MAAVHMVKCLFCGKTFDAQEDGKDIIWYKPRTNRYAHVECGKQNEANKTQDEKDYDTLYRYVKEQQKENFDYIKFKKIVEAWKKEYGFTYNGMYYTLIYFYEVKKNSKQKLIDGSIGIIPFAYKDAQHYYYNIYIASQRAGTGTYDTSKSRVVEIGPPVARTPMPKLFNLDMEDDDEE